MAGSKTAVAETEETLPVPADLFDDYATNQGEGFENADADDYRIPYLQIAQALSPQVDKDDDRLIEGLELGQMFDTVEGNIYDTLGFIPCFFDHAHIEWVPTDQGGGFVGRHELSANILAQTERNDNNRDMLPNGNEIIDTRYLYGLIVNFETGFNKAILVSFARTNTKSCKTLMTVANNLRLQLPNGDTVHPPLYSHVYTLGTAKQTSKAGKKYYTFDLTGAPEVITSKALVDEAKALRKAVSSGTRTAVDETQEGVGPSGGGASSGSDGDPF